MLADGLENEVKTLIADGATRDMQAFNSIGYKEWFDYFEGKTTKEKTIELIKQHNRNYCKRQLTFFKNQFSDIKWYNLDEMDEEDITKHILS